MENKIYVFIGEDTGAFKQMITDYMCVREFIYKREVGDPNLSESDLILYRLGRRYAGGFIDELSVGCDNGEFDPVVFGDFLSKVDEGIDIEPFFEELLSIGVPVLYFAEYESSVERLSGLPIEIYRRVIKKIDPNKKYKLDDIAAMLPEKTDRTLIIDAFSAALEYVRGKAEFKATDMQRYLKCGYNTVWRISDALKLLGVIESIKVTPKRYKSKICK